MMQLDKKLPGGFSTQQHQRDWDIALWSLGHVCHPSLPSSTRKMSGVRGSFVSSGDMHFTPSQQSSPLVSSSDMATLSCKARCHLCC